MPSCTFVFVKWQLNVDLKLFSLPSIIHLEGITVLFYFDKSEKSHAVFVQYNWIRKREHQCFMKWKDIRSTLGLNISMGDKFRGKLGLNISMSVYIKTIRHNENPIPTTLYINLCFRFSLLFEIFWKLYSIISYKRQTTTFT